MTTEKVKNSLNHKLQPDDNPKLINLESFQKEDHLRILLLPLQQKNSFVDRQALYNSTTQQRAIGLALTQALIRTNSSLLKYLPRNISVAYSFFYKK